LIRLAHILSLLPLPSLSQVWFLGGTNASFNSFAFDSVDVLNLTSMTMRNETALSMPRWSNNHFSYGLPFSTSLNFTFDISGEYLNNPSRAIDFYNGRPSIHGSNLSSSAFRDGATATAVLPNGTVIGLMLGGSDSSLFAHAHVLVVNLNTGDFTIFFNALTSARAVGKAAVVGNYAIIAGGVDASNNYTAPIDVIVLFSCQFISRFTLPL
jgi:hypothetical protein